MGPRLAVLDSQGIPDALVHPIIVVTMAHWSWLDWDDALSFRDFLLDPDAIPDYELIERVVCAFRRMQEHG